MGWITILDSVPFINMLDYLPSFLKGLFTMLSDVIKEIRQQVSSALTHNACEEMGRPLNLWLCFGLFPIGGPSTL